MYVENAGNSGGGTIQNNAGVFINNQTTGTNNSNLVIGSFVPTGNFSIYNSSTNNNYFAGNLQIASSNSSPLATLDIRTLSGTLPVASISGKTSFASLVVDQTGLGDIFTASSGGVPHFIISNTGAITDSNYPTDQGILFTNTSGLFKQTLTPASSGLCLLSAAAGATPTWTSCPGGAASTNFWRLSTGALSPLNDTLDVLIGNAATASSKFAFMNVNSGTPIASISAQNANNTALVLGGDETIQSVRNQTLTIGGATTGDIQFKPGNSGSSLYLASNGTVGIGTTTPVVALEINGSASAYGNGRFLRVADVCICQ